MSKEEIIEKIVNSNNKIELLMDNVFLEELREATEIKKGYIILYDTDLLIENIIEKYFSEDEKNEIIDNEDFLNKHKLKKEKIIKLLSDENKINAITKDESIKGWSLKEIIYTLSDEYKIDFLSDVEIMSRYSLNPSDITDIISKLSDEYKMDFLSNIENTTKYSLTQSDIMKIICSFSGEMKVNILNNKSFIEQYELQNDDRMSRIISEMDINFLTKYIQENKSFLEENKIAIYKIVRDIRYPNRQLDFLSHLEEMNLSNRRSKENICCFK